MKKYAEPLLILALFFCVLFWLSFHSIPVSGQTHTFGALDTNNTWTGPNVFTNILDGPAPVTITTTASASLGATYSSGYTLNQNATVSAATTYTLPSILQTVSGAGKVFCVANSQNSGSADTGTIEILTAVTGQFIELNGALSASGGFIISAGAAGDKACVVAIDATHWEAYPQLGTWTLH